MELCRTSSRTYAICAIILLMSMIDRKLLHISFGIFILIQGCSDRDRLNPMDALNPDTHGAPVGLRAIAQKNSITISWDAFDVDDLREFLLYRGMDNNSLELFNSIPPTFLSATDQTVQPDHIYEYALQAVTDFDSSKISEPVFTMPGPYNLWVADHYDFSLWQITYDGNNIIQRFDFTSPTAISWDNHRSKLWIADYFASLLIRINSEGDRELVVELPAYPVDVVWSEQHQSVYTILIDSTLRSFDYSGNPSGSINLDQALTLSSSMAIDDTRDDIWVSYYPKNQVTHVSIDETLSSNTIAKLWTIDGPGPLDIDPGNGVWIASDLGLVHLKENSDSVVTRLYSDWVIYDLSIHQEARRLLYTGRRRYSQEWQTGSISLQQPTEDQDVILLGEDYPDLYNIQVIPTSAGETGFLVQQAYSWRLLRFTPDGTLIGELPNFNSRLDFALY